MFAPPSIAWRDDMLGLRRLFSSVRRVTGVTAAVLAAHISDGRIRLLVLGLEGCDQRILGIDNDVPGALIEFKTNGILHFPAS
jgi:hypothetical protein